MATSTQYRVFIDHGGSTSLVVTTHDIKEMLAAVEREAIGAQRLIVTKLIITKQGSPGETRQA